jgi:hypothetical protein
MSIVIVKNPTPNVIAELLNAKAAAATSPWPEMAGKPYRPGSGTEGMAFDEVWCDQCARDEEFRKDWDNADPAIGCRILANTFVYDIGDPNYPKEWVHDKNGRPCCTAFCKIGEPIPYRCPNTLDLFSPAADDE